MRLPHRLQQLHRSLPPQPWPQQGPRQHKLLNRPLTQAQLPFERNSFNVLLLGCLLAMLAILFLNSGPFNQVTNFLIKGTYQSLSRVANTLAAAYYVDTNNASASDSNPGTEAQPWKTITKANQTLVAGDTVHIKAGTYTSYVAPNNSGTAANRITYRNYNNDVVTIRDTTYAIYLSGKNYITVQGINFTNLGRYMYLINSSNHNIIAYCSFDNFNRSQSTWSGSIIYQDSNNNWIHHCLFANYGFYTDDDIGCVIDIGNEENTMDMTSHNLIENSTWYHGGHHVMGVYGRYNVIRNNYFHNEPWSMGTVYSDRGAILYGDRNLSVAGYAENSGRNLFEGNQIGYASDPPDNVGAAGMSLLTPYNIVRFNRFYHNDRAGLALSLTSSYLADIVYNKVYNNTFFHNGINTQDPEDHMNSGIGFGIYSGTHIIKYNAFKNNLLFSHRVPYGTYYVNLSDQIFANNWDGDSQGDPQFVNASVTLGDPMNANLPNLHLKSSSPCINKGSSLTTITAASGSGMTFTVADAGYFMDGWGIENVSGDFIQLIGTAQRAQIISVNYGTNTITVNSSLSWTQNQGISLLYEGTAPDIGAYEYSSEDPTLTVTVNSPNGGESWVPGSSHNIAWTSTGTIANVKIEYSTNSGSDYATVIASTANSGSYAWTIPNAPSATCLVRVSDASNSSINDISNGMFAITGSSSSKRVDFDGDGKEDILWRHYGTGQNAVWYLGGYTAAGSATALMDSTLQGFPGGVGSMEMRQIQAPKVKRDIELAKDYPGQPGGNINFDPQEAKVFNASHGSGDIYLIQAQMLASGSPQYLSPAVGPRKQAQNVLSYAYLPAVADLNWKIVGTGNFNTDRQIDILWRNYSTGQNAEWFMDGITNTGYAFLPTMSDMNWNIQGTGDFNCDGQTDILWRNNITGQIAVWYMNGASYLSYAFLLGVSDLNWQIMGTGDFNSDGQIDILWRSSLSGENVVWFMNGVTYSSFAYLPTVTNTNWRIMGTGDFNGDGKVDIIWRNSPTGQNAVWYMNGTTNTGYDYLLTVADILWSIVNR